MRSKLFLSRVAGFSQNQCRRRSTGVTATGRRGLPRALSVLASSSMVAATLVVSASTPARAAVPGPPFTQCPAVGRDTSCGIVIEVTDAGAQVLSDPSQGPYDGVEDTLVGVVNDSSHPIDALALRSTTNLFGFEGDGICSYGVGCSGTTGYEGPNTLFSDVSADASSGLVNFPAGLASGASTYFSLEESLSSANVQTGTGQGVVGIHEQGASPNQWENTTTCSTAKPVNCASGEFWHTFVDLSVPGRGVPLGLSRTYNSLNAATDGPFGHGWTSNVTMSLALNAAGDATVTQGGGASVTFAAQSGSFTAPSRVLASLAGNSDGTYTLTDTRTRVRYNFAAAGQLTSEVDRNGNTTTLMYTAGQLATVTDPAGRALMFTSVASRHVTKVVDPAGRTLNYHYDASGNLTAVSDVAGGTTGFAYDSNNLLTAITDPRSGTTTNVYDPQGRVVHQTGPMGRATSFAFTGDPVTATGSTTTITDPRGIATTHRYSQMQLLSVTRAAGTASASSWGYSYDPFTLGVVAVTDPNGARTRYTYDRSGNVLTVTDPLNRVTTMAYNYLNQPTKVSQPSGASTQYGYDYAGNLQSVTSPLTVPTGTSYRTARLTYDTGHPGDVTAVIDPDGATSTFGYDADGNLTSSTDPLGQVGRFGYDRIGRRLASTSPKGNVTTVSYDPFGDVVKTVDPLGHVSTSTLDANRNTTTATDAAGNTTRSAYDADNEPTQVTHADGTVVTYGYDASGNQTSRTDPQHRATGYAYDPLNRVGGVTDPLGGVTNYNHDGAGNTTGVTDPRGIATKLAYDPAHQLTDVTYSDATPAVGYTYTTDGQRATMTDGTGTSRYTYDTLHRLTASTDGNGKTVGYGHDLDGHVTALTYPNGQIVTRAYDTSGRLTGVTDWNGKTTTITPDAEGNTANQTYGNGVTAAATFDPTGQVSKITDNGPAGALASFVYTRDTKGQLASETSTGTGTGQPNQTYTYTPLSQLASVNTAALGYDPTGNVTQLPAGGSLTYNAASELTALKTADGDTTTYNYDTAGDRTAVSGGPDHTAGACGVCILSPAAAGALSAVGTSTVNSSGVITVNSTAPGAIRAVGRASITGTRIYTAGSAPTTGQGAVTPTPTPGTSPDPLAGAAVPAMTGAPTAVNLTSGSQTLHPGVYSTISASGSAALTLTPGDYILTGDVNVTGSATLTGSGATVYLTCASYPNPCATATSGAALHVSGAATFTVNGPADTSGIALFADRNNTAGLTVTGGAAVKLTGHLYAPAGTVTLDGHSTLVVTGTIAVGQANVNGTADLTNTSPLHQLPGAAYNYDAAHRLTHIQAAASTTYRYNGDGLRTSSTTGQATQQYAWNLTSNLPLMLTDGTTNYLYDDSGAPIEQIAADGTTLYYQHDQYGSTRLLTDAAGVVAATYTYSAHGRVTSRTGIADTPLRWNGQYQDASGLYYLRARYYDPATAQFMTVDPRLALTGQAYGFSGNNPRNASDPTGLCSWYDAVCGVGVGATWVADNAGNISAVAGIAAVIIAPIPVLDVLSPVLGGISVATGAFATGKDLGNGNYVQALVDGAGTLLGGAGLAEDLLARGLMGAARTAWDSGMPVIDLAKGADAAERVGGLLDKTAAGVAIFGAYSDHQKLFETSDHGAPTIC